jgi:hypothetical protein
MKDDRTDAAIDLAGRKAKNDQASDPWVVPLGVITATLVASVLIFGASDSDRTSTVASNNAPDLSRPAATPSAPAKAPTQ